MGGSGLRGANVAQQLGEDLGTNVVFHSRSLGCTSALAAGMRAHPHLLEGPTLLRSSFARSLTMHFGLGKCSCGARRARAARGRTDDRSTCCA